jgi:hypothetical protein
VVSALHNFLAAARYKANIRHRDRQTLAHAREAKQEGCNDMSDVWDTKDGRRRVRRDPPTVEEAVLAAQGLSDELKEQIEIVASLMEMAIDQARSAVLKLGQRRDVSRMTIVGPVGATRAVVVERRAPRRFQRSSLGR